MADISKARVYLKQRGSKLQHLESFALMLASAEAHYKSISVQKGRKIDLPGTWDNQEAEAALDLAALRHLKNHGRLPANVSEAFGFGITSEEKLELAKQWFNA